MAKIEVKGAVVQQADGAADEWYPDVHSKLGQMSEQPGANPFTLGNGANKANAKECLPLEEVQNTTGCPFPPRQPNSPVAVPPEKALQVLSYSSLDFLQGRVRTGRDLGEEPLSIDVNGCIEVRLSQLVHRDRSCPGQSDDAHVPYLGPLRFAFNLSVSDSPVVAVRGSV
jgi:hypothetical protein